MLKDYEVIALGVVQDGKPCLVGKVIQGDPRNGNIQSGLHFKQLKPKVNKAASPARKAAAPKPFDTVE